MSGQHMSRELRKDMIMEDFRFLEEIKVHEINGKLMMGDGEIPYNIGHVFYEKEFVTKWLMQFALGNYFGVNYFNVEQWCALTNNGTRAVLVCNDDHEPVLLIQPLIAHNLTPEDFRLLRAASWHMHHKSADTQFGNDPNLNMKIATQINERLSATKRTTYTDMILPEYFEKHGVIPEVEQKIYYIKDVVRGPKDPVKMDDVNEKLRPIMYKHHKGEKVTKEERAFVTEMVKGKISIDGLTDDAPAAADVKEGEPARAEVPDNPLDC